MESLNSDSDIIIDFTNKELEPNDHNKSNTKEGERKIKPGENYINHSDAKVLSGNITISLTGVKKALSTAQAKYYKNLDIDIYTSMTIVHELAHIFNYSEYYYIKDKNERYNARENDSNTKMLEYLNEVISNILPAIDSGWLEKFL